MIRKPKTKNYSIEVYMTYDDKYQDYVSYYEIPTYTDSVNVNKTTIKPFWYIASFILAFLNIKGVS